MSSIGFITLLAVLASVWSLGGRIWESGDARLNALMRIVGIALMTLAALGVAVLILLAPVPGPLKLLGALFFLVWGVVDLLFRGGVLLDEVKARREWEKAVNTRVE